MELKSESDSETKEECYYTKKFSYVSVSRLFGDSFKKGNIVHKYYRD